MPEKTKTRPYSASRQQRPSRYRTSSLHADSNAIVHHEISPGNTLLLSCIDLRTIPQKIEDLRKEMRGSASNQNLDHLLLMQVYVNLQYGDTSIENARAYFNLSQYYFHRKTHYLPQAKFHALHARDILERLKIQPMENQPVENLLAYAIYKILLQCSLNAQQREAKSKNKHILAIDKSHIEHDLKLMNRYLGKLKEIDDYERLRKEYLLIKFDVIVMNVKVFNNSIYELIDQIEPTVNSYVRCGSYLLNFKETIEKSLVYYRKGVELAEEEERRAPSKESKHQLASAILQRSVAKVKAHRLTEDLEKEFQRAIELYKQPHGETNKQVLNVIDELATYYLKAEKYQDALNNLCETLPDKIRLYGDFSEEVIQTESRIGAIYLREGECLNAAEHLKVCLDLQEFVYGPNDSRTCQTRDTVELLKNDPMVSRTYFARPAFRTFKKISYEKDDLRLLPKPPMSSKS